MAPVADSEMRSQSVSPPLTLLSSCPPAHNGAVVGADVQTGRVPAGQQRGGDLRVEGPAGGHQAPADTDGRPGQAAEEAEQGGSEPAPPH